MNRLSPERFANRMMAIASTVAMIGMVTTCWGEHPIVWFMRAGMIGLVCWQIWLFNAMQAKVGLQAEIRAARNDELLRLERERKAHRDRQEPYERAEREQWHEKAMEDARRNAAAGGPGLAPAIAVAHPVQQVTDDAPTAPGTPRKRVRRPRHDA